MSASAPQPGDPGPAQGEIERRFQTLVESIPGVAAYMDLVHPHDPDHSTPVFISPQIEAMLGYPREAWLTDEELWLNVIHPDDAERMTRADSAARANLDALFAEYRMIARDGRVIWVSEKASVVRDPATGTVYWLGVMVDITDRKRVEESLAASESQFRSMFDAAAIGVMTLAVDGTIIEANPTLERVCKYPRGALNGRPLSAYLDPDDRESRRQFDQVASGAVDRCEIEHRLTCSDHTLMWCRTVAVLIRDGDGRPARVTAMIEDISDRKREEDELVHRTLHDSLTGLPNRSLFVDRLEQAQARQARGGSGIAVLFVDMDGFKQVNDSLGHAAGDELLVAVARRLRAAVRPTDTIARYAGDEFLVLIEAVASAADALEHARRVTRAVQAPYALDGNSLCLTASTGVYLGTDPAEGADSIIHKADTAMYRAKRQGPNRVHLVGGDAEHPAAA
jgi:diguanylate cyclase (GGDEF)-like protein/PAS domain S-box-containing protein